MNWMNACGLKRPMSIQDLVLQFMRNGRLVGNRVAAGRKSPAILCRPGR